MLGKDRGKETDSPRAPDSFTTVLQEFINIYIYIIFVSTSILVQKRSLVVP